LLSILSGTWAQNLDVSGAEIKEGESATLSCTPRGSGTPESVSWNFVASDGTQTTIFDYNPNKGKEGVTPEHADRWSSRTNSFDITIQNAMRFDNGTYVCIAQLNIGPRFGNADLTVLVPPSAPRIVDPSDGKLIAGKAGKLSCKSDDGIPNPEYTWYKNGQLLPLNSAEDPLRFPNSSFTIQKDEMTNDKVIIFSTVSDQDEGDYYCVAENKAGTVQGNPVSISVGSVSVASVVGIVFGVIFGIALLLVVAFMVIKKMKGDDDDDDGYDGEDDGANDVMIGDQNDDYYRHNSSNRHEASLVV